MAKMGNSKNKAPRVSEELLFLTNISNTQQLSDEEKQKIKQRRRLKRFEMRGQPFRTRPFPSSWCRERRLATLKLVNGVLRKVVFKCPGCKSWTCPKCQIKKAIHLKYMLMEIIEMNDLKYFLTLTLDPKKIPRKYKTKIINNTHEFVTKKFNHFTTILRRKSFKYVTRYGNTGTLSLKKQEEKLKYVWVLQFQPQTGNAHLHILLNKYLPIDIVRQVWTHVGGGHIMKVENVRSPKGISHYVTDYVVEGIKNAGSYEQNGGRFKYFERRYMVSNSCIRPPKKSKALYPDLTPEQRKWALKADSLDWVYNALCSEDFKEGEIDINPNDLKPL